MVVKDLLVLMAPEAGGDGGTLSQGHNPQGKETKGSRTTRKPGEQPAGEGSVTIPGLGGVAKGLTMLLRLSETY